MIQYFGKFQHKSNLSQKRYEIDRNGQDFEITFIVNDHSITFLNISKISN